MDTINCDGIINVALHQVNGNLSKRFSSDVILLKAPMRQTIDDMVKNEIEEIKSKGISDKLTVLLETNGGYIETVERIVNVFRRHYSTVDFIVPNYAYSAGTILVLSGDDIYMNYYSVLGPIDPQLSTEDGTSVPGMGYLAKFEELVELINKETDPAKTRAEVAYLIKKFDPAMLFTIEQAIEHSKALIREWLPKYKFKDWHFHSSTGEAVKPADKEERADKIAGILGDTKRWHSHGRGVSIKELESNEIKLKIKNYSDDAELEREISQYHGLFIDYLRKQGFEGAIHTTRGLRRLA